MKTANYTVKLTVPEPTPSPSVVSGKWVGVSLDVGDMAGEPSLNSVRKQGDSVFDHGVDVVGVDRDDPSVFVPMYDGSVNVVEAWACHIIG